MLMRRWKRYASRTAESSVVEKVVLPRDQFTPQGDPKLFVSWNNSDGDYFFTGKTEQIKKNVADHRQDDLFDHPGERQQGSGNVRCLFAQRRGHIAAFGAGLGEILPRVYKFKIIYSRCICQ